MMPYIIEKDLPALLEYIDSRLVQTEQVRAIKSGVLDQDKRGIAALNIWFNTSEYVDKIIKKPCKDGKQELERPIKVEFIDMPFVYHYNHELCE